MEQTDSVWFGFWESIQKNFKNLIIFNSIILILAVIISFIVPKWYKATAVILPATTQTSGLDLLKSLGGVGGLASGLFVGNSPDINRYLTILKSRTLKEKVIQKYNLIKEYGSENMEEAIKEFEDNLDVEVGDEMQVEISFLDKNQNRVAEMTNYIVHCLDSINITLTVKEAKTNKEFINSRLNIVIDSLKLLQNELKTFMEKYGVLDLENQVIVGLQSIGEVHSMLLQKQIELDVARKQMRKDNLALKKLKTELSVLKNQYKKFFHDSLNKDRLVPPLTEIPELYVKFFWLKKQIEYYEKLIEFLAPQFENAKIQEAKTIPTLQILDYAVRPEKKHLPKRWLIVLIALVLSVTFSIYYVYWREHIFTRLRR